MTVAACSNGPISSSLRTPSRLRSWSGRKNCGGIHVSMTLYATPPGMSLNILLRGRNWFNVVFDGRPTQLRGVALVTAAIECRRAGWIGPLPINLVEQVHTDYLNPATPPKHWVRPGNGLPPLFLVPPPLCSPKPV